MIGNQHRSISAMRMIKYVQALVFRLCHGKIPSWLVATLKYFVALRSLWLRLGLA
jgi:hypothetical protein